MNHSPEIVQCDGFLLVGVERYTDTGMASLQSAWDEFDRRRDEIKHPTSPKVIASYEDYSRDYIENAGGFPKFYFIAGMKVESLDDVPSGMKGIAVKPGTFAKFVHSSPTSELAATFRFIYAEWLPASKYILDPKIGGDCEIHTPPSADGRSGAVEIYIPITEKP